MLLPTLFAPRFFSGWMLLLATLLATNGCIELYHPQIAQINYNLLVVEGFLVEGADTTLIRLGRTQTLEGTRNEIVKETSALVQVQDEQGNIIVLSNNKDGTYHGVNLPLDNSKRYSLSIRTQDGKEYTSDFVTIKHSPQLDTVKWQEENEGIQISLSTHDPDNKTTYYMWDYKETWKYSVPFLSVYKIENGEIKPREFADEFYFCWRSLSADRISINSTRALSRDVVNNYKLLYIPLDARKLEYEYSLLVSQYAISKEAFDYWENLKRNNELRGTLFDPTPAMDVGNLHCVSHPNEPVLGYFSASSVSKKRIFIDRQEITGPRFGYATSDYSYCQANFIPYHKMSELRPTGFLIVDSKFDEVTQQTGYIVATESCVDCRKLGGTNKRPSYWK